MIGGTAIVCFWVPFSHANRYESRCKKWSCDEKNNNSYWRYILSILYYSKSITMILLATSPFLLFIYATCLKCFAIGRRNTVSIILITIFEMNILSITTRQRCAWQTKVLEASFYKTIGHWTTASSCGQSTAYVTVDAHFPYNPS